PMPAPSKSTAPWPSRTELRDRHRSYGRPINAIKHGTLMRCAADKARVSAWFHGQDDCYPGSVIRINSGHIPLRMSEPKAQWQTSDSSARFPKFVRHRGNPLYELRKAKGTSKSLILVPLSI